MCFLPEGLSRAKRGKTELKWPHRACCHIRHQMIRYHDHIIAIQTAPQLSFIIIALENSLASKTGYFLIHGQHLYTRLSVISPYPPWAHQFITKFHWKRIFSFSSYLQKLASNLYWAGIKPHIVKFVIACPICQQQNIWAPYLHFDWWTTQFNKYISILLLCCNIPVNILARSIKKLRKMMLGEWTPWKKLFLRQDILLRILISYK